MIKLIPREIKERYSKILMEMGIVGEGVLEKNKVAALYIICAKEELWCYRKSIFNLRSHEIKENALNQINGNGNKTLVLLAFNLFNSYKDKETDVFNILKNINRQDRDLVLNAINIVWS